MLWMPVCFDPNGMTDNPGSLTTRGRQTHQIRTFNSAFYPPWHSKMCMAE